MEPIKHTFRVRYAETDAMGVVYYANYLVWFEVGRGEFLRAAGLPYTALEAAGVAAPVVGADVRYRRSAHYDDELTIETWVSELKPKLIYFSYRILRGDELLATGSTTHAFVMNGVSRAVKLDVEAPELWAQMAGWALPDQADVR